MIEMLSGEMGGMLALAFGTGAGAGYGFAMKTATNEARKRIEALEAEVSELRANYISELKGRG